MVLNSFKSDALFSKAQKLAGQNRPKEAISLYDQAIDLNPKSSGALLHKALALAETGNYDAAVESVRRAIELRPKNPVYSMFLGLIQYDRHDFDGAIQAFDRALTVDRHYEIAAVFKDLVDFTTGNMEEAFTRLKGNYNWGLDFQSRLLMVCETYLSEHKAVSNSYFKSDLTLANGANSHFKRFLIELKYRFLCISQLIDFDQPTREMKEVYRRGNRHLSLQEFDQALEEYQKIIEDGRPGLSEKALQQAVEVFLAQCDFQNALKHIEMVQAFQSTLSFLGQLPERPDSPSKYPALNLELVLVMGIIHYELENFAKSSEILSITAELDPKNYLIDYYMGLDALALNETDRLRIARNRFKKALAAVNEGLLAKRVAETMRVFRLINE